MTCAPRVTQGGSMTADDSGVYVDVVVRSLLAKRATGALIGLQRHAGLKLMLSVTPHRFSDTPQSLREAHWRVQSDRPSAP